ncbi:unnamed protein product [Ixodes persulcatus]
MHDDMIDFFAHAPTRHEPRRKTGTFQGVAFTGFDPQSSIWGAQLKEKSGKKEKRGSAQFGSIWMSEQIGTAPAAALECSADPPYVHHSSACNVYRARIPECRSPIRLQSWQPTT